MMKVVTAAALLLACCSVLSVNLVTAQAERVNFKFEVDAKQVNEKLRVLLYLDGKAIEPEMHGNSFTVPPEVRQRENIGVRFLSDKYDLYFDPVFIHDLKTDWMVGIDNKPFEKENINANRKYKNVIFIRYINFIPQDGAHGTRMTIEVKRDNQQ